MIHKQEDAPSRSWWPKISGAMDFEAAWRGRHRGLLSMKGPDLCLKWRMTDKGFAL